MPQRSNFGSRELWLQRASIDPIIEHGAPVSRKAALRREELLQLSTPTPTPTPTATPTPACMPAPPSACSRRPDKSRSEASTSGIKPLPPIEATLPFCSIYSFVFTSKKVYDSHVRSPRPKVKGRKGFWYLNERPFICGCNPTREFSNKKNL